MDDRIAEIREVLEVPARPVPDTVPDMRGLYALPLDVLDKRTAAARAYVDLLGSDALIIRRDENGQWPQQILDLMYEYKATPGQSASYVLRAMVSTARKLASSQGVEP